MAEPAQKIPGQKSCCGPSRGGRPVAPSVTTDACRRVASNAVSVPGGVALVGTSNPVIPNDGEDPVRRQRVSGFLMGATAVTNAEFRTFVEATGYQTEAERFGWSFVFWSHVPKSVGATQAVVEVEWWRRVPGAVWSAPHGPGTEHACLPDHPVVQVSWNDARAYCDWVGGRLPNEAEWEHAARAGEGDVRFPWGNSEPNDTDFQPCNIWQGHFPETDLARDGYSGTAPAQSYQPNSWGFYNMVGNTWEWTSQAYTIKSLKRGVKERLKSMRGYKVLKGGSFLCHASYCYRYRIAARSGNSPDSTTTHQGFRVVWDG